MLSLRHLVYSLGSIMYESRLCLPDYNLCGNIPGVDGVNACKRSLASLHPGGINFVLADGATRFVSTDTDMNVLAAMATIANRETVKLP